MAFGRKERGVEKAVVGQGKFRKCNLEEGTEIVYPVSQSRDGNGTSGRGWRSDGNLASISRCEFLKRAQKLALQPRVSSGKALARFQIPKKCAR